MSKIVWAFILAPVSGLALYGIVTGSMAVVMVGFAFVYMLMLVPVLPLVLLCIKLRWVKWWHAGIIGVAIAIAFTWITITASNPYYVEINGIADLFSYVAIGYIIAMVFWAIAVYRNNKFPYVPRGFPWLTLVILIMLTATNRYVGYATHTTQVNGVIVAMLAPDGPEPMARVKLASGETVQARLMCYSTYSVGNPVHVDYRSRSMLFRDRYWIEDVITDPGKFNLNDYMANGTKCYDEMWQRIHMENKDSG